LTEPRSTTEPRPVAIHHRFFIFIFIPPETGSSLVFINASLGRLTTPRKAKPNSLKITSPGEERPHHPFKKGEGQNICLFALRMNIINIYKNEFKSWIGVAGRGDKTDLGFYN